MSIRPFMYFMPRIFATHFSNLVKKKNITLEKERERESNTQEVDKMRQRRKWSFMSKKNTHIHIMLQYSVFAIEKDYYFCAIDLSNMTFYIKKNIANVSNTVISSF